MTDSTTGARAATARAAGHRWDEPEGAEDEPAPAEHLAEVARAVAKDVTRLSTLELARLIYVLKAAVVAVECEIIERPCAEVDASCQQAAGELAPRRPAEPS